MKKPFNWKLFWILLAAAILGGLALQPYSQALLSISGKALSAGQIAGGMVSAAIQLAVFIGLGLLMGNVIGLGLPILEAALRREPVGNALRSMLPISIVLGAVAALLVVLLERFVFQPAILAELGPNPLSGTTGAKIAAWKGFLASFYGGIDEEILLRLFLMTLLAWLGHFVSRTADGRPTLAVLWIANILAALAFGLSHLPGLADLVPLTPLVVTRTLIGNGLVGIVCGYLYMKRGLESAIVAHFSADIVLHVLFGT